MTLDDAQKQKEIDAAWKAHRAAQAAQEAASSVKPAIVSTFSLSAKIRQIDEAWCQQRAIASISAAKRRRSLRDRLSAEQNHRCCMCGARTNEPRSVLEEPTLEHLVPRGRGGPDTYENCVMTCAGCNNRRGSAPLPVA